MRTKFYEEVIIVSANMVKAIVIIGGLGLMTTTVLLMNKLSKKQKEKNN